jgi:L-rhamnose isomerase
MKQTVKATEQAYRQAAARYAEAGVDTEQALKTLEKLAVSIHCWQGDDVGGFETPDATLSGGGIQATGNYPGKARNADELRADLDTALSLIPGRHRVNLHACYAETGGRRVDRNQLEPDHFRHWMDWARARKLGLDFNGTFFSHPKADDGFTLAHPSRAVRRFWIEHGQACRRIGAAMGQATGSPCVTNVWIPDGFKDWPEDRRAPRERLKAALDEVMREKISPRLLLDAVESKLFGIGSESYVVGSHEFYMGYALRRDIMLCLDAGHFHPTESIADKISSVLTFMDRLLLHVSRSVRWDSDHVVVLNDELRAIAEEIVRNREKKSLYLALDFFDAQINRVAAWVIGTRCMIKALLLALLRPAAALRAMERAGDYTGRLAWQEELKTLPYGAVWDMYCLRRNVPVGAAWLDAVRRYEQDVQFKRQ